MAAEPQRRPIQKPAGKPNIAPQNGQVDERLHNTQVERAALGALLLDNRLALSLPEWIAPNWLLADAAETVDTSMPAREPLFFSRANQAIFGAIVRLVEREQPFDLTVLCEELQLVSMLEAVGGAPYLISLEDDVVSLAQVPTYFNIILDKWRRRFLLRNAEAIAKSAIDGPVSGALRRLESEVIETLDRAQSSRMRLWRPSETMALEHDPTDNILGDDYLSMGGITGIVGQGGIGKSRLIVQMLIEIIMGFDQTMGFEIRKPGAKVIVFQTQNMSRRIKRELKLQLKGCTGAQRAAVDECFRINLPDQCEDVLDSVLSLDDPDTIHRMSHECKLFQPDIVLFDPLDQFFVGEDENKSIDMGRTIRTMLKIARAGNPRACLVIVHHAKSGKGAIASGSSQSFEKGKYARGSSAFQNIVRCQFNVLPGAPDDFSNLVVSCGKINDGRYFDDFAVRLDPETMMYHRDETFDLAAWNERIRDAKPKGPTREDRRKAGNDLITLIMRGMGGTWFRPSDVAEALASARSVSRSTAFNAIKRAVSEGTLIEADGKIALRED